MDLDDSMHDGNVPSINVEDYNLAVSKGGFAHVEEENVTAVKGWLHASTQNHNNLPTTT